MSNAKLRRWVLTGSVAAITATGAWYGAGLKIQQEYKQEQKQRSEASPQSQIQNLEAVRANLVRQRDEVQKKMDQILARQNNGTEKT